MNKYLSALKLTILFSLLFNQNNLYANYQIKSKLTEDKKISSNITIEELKKRIENSQIELNTNGTIAEELILEGYVVSSDETENFYKTLSIQNNYINATSGIQVEVDRVSLFHTFPLGSKVNVSLKNLKVGFDKGIYKIGWNDPVYSIGRIPTNEINNFLSRADDDIYEIVPKEYNSISEALKEENLNTLIKIKNIQFKNPEIDKTYADALTNVSRELIDKKQDVLDLRNSGYATWWNEVLPMKSGTITIILSRFNQKYQAYIRDIYDVNFTEDRFEVDTNTTNNQEGSELLFQGSDFNNWDVFLSSLNSFGLIGSGNTYAKKGVSIGRDNSDALYLDGNPLANDYVFTAVKNKNKPINSTKITFYIKGTSLKSLSFNLYTKDGGYIPYNLREVSNKSVTITGEETNSYVGSIDTKGEWVLVTLDISNVELQDMDHNRLIALKVGREGNYNLIIDNLKIGDKNLSVNDVTKPTVIVLKENDKTIIMSEDIITELEIYSVSGQKVQTFKLNAKRFVLPYAFQNGMYIIKVNMKNNIILTKKIIL